MKKLFEKNPLFFAFLLPAATDGLVTILGQGEAYWRATDKVINEASPAYYFLAFSPWLYVVGSLVWFVIWYWIFLRLKNASLKLWIALLFIAGHSWGSASWLTKFLQDAGVWSLNNILVTNFFWCLLVLYFAVVALIATYCIQLHFTQKKHNSG